MAIIVKEQNGTQLSVPFIGKNMVDFLDRVTLIDTKIGVIKTFDVFGVTKDMICSGQIIEQLDNPNYTYTDINTEFDKSNKFLSVDEMSAARVVKNYCEAADIDASPYLDKISKINNNLLVIVPFKPGRTFYITATSKMDSVTDREMVLSMLKWATGEESHKLEAKLIFKGKRSSDLSTFELPITEYLSTFKMYGAKDKIVDNLSSSDVIKFDPYGIIKPIEFVDKDKTIIVDGNFLYEKINDKVNIIGIWDPNGVDMIAFKKLGQSKMMKKLTASIELISNHRKYIAPYKLFKTNVIDK